MDVKWKDGEGNILNANNERIIYYGVETDSKTKLTKEEVKKITIEDGLMNIFKDFENDLVLTIVIPKKSKRNAVRIFNEYDKTGEVIKGKSNNFLLNLILESSISNPIFGLSGIAFALLVLVRFIQVAISEVVVDVIKIIVIGYIAYSIILYVLTKIKRKKLKEV